MGDSTRAEPGVSIADRRGILAWCFYDWANSPFPTVVLTFVIPAYFEQAIVADTARATTQWGFMQGTVALVIAVLAPVLGSIADHGGRRKPWLAVATAAMVAVTALLWFATPEPGSATLLLVLVAVGLVSFELAMVFYNAMLPGVAPSGWTGRVSGWAWGLGYLGGLAGLAAVLFGFIQVEPPPFGLDRAAAEHVRASGPLVAVWAAVFALPVFLFTPDRGGQGHRGVAAIRIGLGSLWQTLRQLAHYGPVARFLLARMLYTDGINTVFAFGGLYAAGTFGMPISQVILFGIVLNVTAGVGAFALGWLDDWLGSKPTILIAIVGLVATGVPLLLVESILWFWILGAALGLFVGPAQAASRSLMAHLAPKGLEAEMFGLYAFSGKATAFVGPWLVATLAAAFGSQRIGLATVIPFLVVGGVLLLAVRPPAEARADG